MVAGARPVALVGPRAPLVEPAPLDPVEGDTSTVTPLGERVGAGTGVVGAAAAPGEDTSGVDVGGLLGAEGVPNVGPVQAQVRLAPATIVASPENTAIDMTRARLSTTPHLTSSFSSD